MDLLQNELSLPKIAESQRIIPNDLVRSALFTVSNRNKKREYLKDSKLVTIGNTVISYTGEELRQDDEDIWMHFIFSCSRKENLEYEFSPYTFLRLVGWPQRVHMKERLKATIQRMSATNLTVYNKTLGQGLSISLIRKFMWQDDEGNNLKKWRIWLEPELLQLFGKYQYSRIHWDQRKKLNPLAKWLHSYYSSHAEPFAIGVETIYKASGSKVKAKKHFKAMIRNSLVELVQLGFLEDFFIDANELVHVIKANKQRQIQTVRSW